MDRALGAFASRQFKHRRREAMSAWSETRGMKRQKRQGMQNRSIIRVWESPVMDFALPDAGGLLPDVIGAFGDPLVSCQFP
jgi:hypothetical protein